MLLAHLLLSLGALLRPLAPQRTAVRMSEWSADIAALGESLEARVCELETASCDPATFAAAMDELTELRKAGLKPGSSAYTAVVVEAAQRVDAQRWLSQQRVVQEGVQMVRDRDQAERDAAAAKAAAANSKAAALAAAAREAAGRKRAELLGYIFEEQAPAPAGAGLALARPPSVSTDAALGMLFNSGYDAEGMLALTATDLAQLKGIGASLTKALRRDGESVELLLRRAALLVAMGQPALARNDYDRVLELDAENAEAQKYFNLANYGTGFDPYEVLGVPRGADGEAISLAFRRLAKQWHPDRWVNAPDAERLEAETRFKQLNLAQGVLADKAKRKKYDEGTASVADLMIGFWEKLTQKRSRRKRSTIAAGA